MLTMAHALGLDDLQSLGDSTGAMDLNTASETTIA
jgi:hypothetical protein